MKRFWLALNILFIAFIPGYAQNSFNYSFELQPVPIQNLPGLHSYAFAQHGGKWLVIGGRRDGIHARQPFNAFPQSQNNTNIYVIDVPAKQVWSASLSSLPGSLQEQLQATNLNFVQVADTLYITGGYAFSPTANDYITFPHLTTIQVSGLIQAVVNSAPITGYIKQISDTAFAVTGGRMGFLNNQLILVGGHKFTGRYNPMGNPTYLQQYTNQIRRFRINNSGSQPVMTSYTVTTDPVHLRRRDYNLVPQLFPNGTHGYTISSGVFQPVTDLPFLYPVDITDTSYIPVTSFNQYLSNYHSAYASLFDSTTQEMHTVFFGGISQYYYQNGVQVQDPDVPFVKTISRLTRNASGNFQEFKMPGDMPGFLGASAEFIPDLSLPHYGSEILRLHALQQDTVVIGHIFGGLASPSLNPFSVNQASTTSATATVYEVRLIKQPAANVQAIDGSNPYDVTAFPNPATDVLRVSFRARSTGDVPFFITDGMGRMVGEGLLQNVQAGENERRIPLPGVGKSQRLVVTFVFDGVFFVSRQVITQER